MRCLPISTAPTCVLMAGVMRKGTEAADKFMKENQFADAQTAYADRAAALSLAGGGGADAALLASW